MYTPVITEEQRELVDKIISLPKQSFQDCFILIERENWFIELEQESLIARKKSLEKEDLFLSQGRIKAEYYAKMRLTTATLELEDAKRHINKVYENWDKLEKDAPIYWSNIKTEDGYNQYLVGDVARDYKKEKSDTGVEYTFPDNKKVTR